MLTPVVVSTRTHFLSWQKDAWASFPEVPQHHYHCRLVFHIHRPLVLSVETYPGIQPEILPVNITYRSIERFNNILSSHHNIGIWG